MTTHRFARWMAVLVLTMAFAPIVSASAQKPTELIEQERAQRARDEEAVRQMRDPGYDLAVVTTPDATIRAQADFSSAALRSLKRGEVLALVERNPTGIWYSVIHIDSATEGWVRKEEVVLKFSTSKRESPTISAERGESGEEPSIVITNDADTELNLRIAEDLYSIPARAKRMVILKPGRYKFHAFRPKVKPVFGEHLFESGYNYRWIFWTATRMVR